MLEVEKLRSCGPKKEVSLETFGSLFDEYKEKTRLDQDISRATKEGRVYAIKRIVKTLPGIEGKKPMNLEIGEVVEWIRRPRLMVLALSHQEPKVLEGQQCLHGEL